MIDILNSALKFDEKYDTDEFSAESVVIFSYSPGSSQISKMLCDLTMADLLKYSPYCKISIDGKPFFMLGRELSRDNEKNRAKSAELISGSISNNKTEEANDYHI